MRPESSEKDGPLHLWVGRVSQWLAYGAVVALCGLALVTFTDVILRYFFNAPISGAVEIIYILMGLLVFLGLALVTFEDGHIRVDVITNLMPRSLRRWVDLLVGLLSVGVAALVAWRLTIVAVDKVEERDATMIFELPIWAVAIVGAICGIAFVAALWVRFVALWREPAPSGDPDP